ncbi:MAG: phosphate signaling complex protein PhoU [[Clostridium] symbiosum]|uniref:phosphate signaling complex protein PhoU n=1 Tax=Clostridium symbiosum TaxID=1512 RepID=UPI0024203A99|nr:phosphate signaling complex protein PhoU [[Clostridium] symbiosum]
MRAEYDRQLRELEEELFDMGSMCQQAVAFSGAVLIGDDETLREQVCSLEMEIDKKDRQIENICTGLLLRQTPVAGDLRFVSAALKIVSDMERIGDQAADIAELSRYISEKPLLEKVHISDICCVVMNMVTDSVEALVKKDEILARKVIGDDDIADDLFVRIKEELVSLIQENRTEPQEILDLLMAAKYFERVGDHAVNIAEWVEFIVTGMHDDRECGH